MSDKLKNFTAEDFEKAMKDPKVKKKLKKIADEFLKKQHEELMKPKFIKNNGCNCCCCRKY